MIVRLLLAALCSFAIITVRAQSYGYSLPKNQKSIKIPFEIWNRLIVLKVSVNKSKPLNFILDTGSRNTLLIKPELKDSLDLQSSGKLFVLGAGLKDTVEADIIRQVSLSCGGLKGDFQSILVLNKALPEISQMLGIDIHGVLGADLFNRFAINVNYKKRIIQVVEPEFLKVDSRYEEIPVEISNSKGYINVLLKNDWGNYQVAKLMIDCGASLSMLFNYADTLSAEVQYPYFKRYIETKVGIGLSGIIPGQIGRLKLAQIGLFSFEDIIASAVPYNEINTLYLNERDGLLGSEILSRFNIWYNFPKEKIFLYPSKGINRPFEHDMSGVIHEGIKDDNGNILINQVVEGSSAFLAGIRMGDIMTTINGNIIKYTSISDIDKILKKRPGHLIRLGIIRDNKNQTVSFRLKAYL